MTVQLRPWKLMTKHEYLRRRVLTLLAGDPDWQSTQVCRLWSWSFLRYRIGGRWKSSQVREVVDELLDEGVIIELWDAMPDRREPKHLLFLARCWHKFEFADLIAVRGDEDLLAKLEIQGHVDRHGGLDVWGSKQTLLRQLGLDYLADQITEDDE